MNASRRQNQIVIFGTGEFGKIVHHCLVRAGYSPVAFIDLNERNIGRDLQGIPIIGISGSISSTIVLASNRNNYQHLYSLLGKYRLTNVEECDDYLEYIDYETLEVNWSRERVKSEIRTHLSRSKNRKTSNEELVVNSLDVVVTEKCSLKCKDCSNLMQYYQSPVTVQEESLLNNLKSILDALEYVTELRFIGGEPLLFKGIYGAIEEICNFNNFEELIIFTNGTIAPKGHQLEKLKDERIRFQISDYGKISRRTEQLILRLDEHNIRYVNDRVTAWQDCAQIERKERTLDETESVFANCCVNDAFTLLHGKVYGCPFGAHAENLSAIPVSESDSFLVSGQSGKTISDGFGELISLSSYRACDYCNGRDYSVSVVEAAVQVKVPIPYQRVES